MAKKSTSVFDALKAEILALGAAKDACRSQYERAEQATTPAELLRVVKDNFAWCWTNKVVTTAILERFGEQVLWAERIYITGSHDIDVRGEAAAIHVVGDARARVTTRESSSAEVTTWESSSARVTTWESSSARVTTRESSSAEVTTWESSKSTIAAYGRSVARDFSAKKVYVYHEADWEIVQYTEPVDPPAVEESPEAGK